MVIVDSGVQLVVFTITVVVVPTLVPVIALGLAVPVLHLGRTGVLLAHILAESRVFLGADPGHHLHDRRHGLGLVMTEVPHKELVVGTVLEHGDGIRFVALDDLIFLLEESGLVTTYRFLLPLPHIGQVTSIRRSDVLTSEVPRELGLKVCQPLIELGEGVQPSPS